MKCMTSRETHATIQISFEPSLLVITMTNNKLSKLVSQERITNNDDSVLKDQSQSLIILGWYLLRFLCIEYFQNFNFLSLSLSVGW